MEEEVNQRVVTLSVNTGRMTASVLARTMSNFLAREHQALNRRSSVCNNADYRQDSRPGDVIFHCRRI